MEDKEVKYCALFSKDANTILSSSSWSLSLDLNIILSKLITLIVDIFDTQV